MVECFWISAVKSLTMLKGEGCFFPPPAASHPPGGLNSTPDSEDWGGGGGGRGCGWRAVWRAAGCPVWRPGPRTPQILHCLRGQHCPGNWPKAIKDQPKGRSHPRTDAGHPPPPPPPPPLGYAAASEKRKDVPSADRG